MNYLAGEEVNEKLGSTGIVITSYLKYSDKFAEIYPQYNMKVFFDAAANYSYIYPSSIANLAWGDIVWNELVRAYSLEISVDEACDNIMAQLGQ